MDPQRAFCPNLACRERGRRGAGNIGIHSQKERRYVCRTCTKTFAATSGTVHYRLRTPAEVVTQVVTLLCHGCPPQAIVAAFGLDERTVADWQQRAGTHCQAVHEHLVQAGQVDLGQVQADELYVKVCKPQKTATDAGDGDRQSTTGDGTGRVWQAMALAVPSRLWLGGVISAHRDTALIRSVAQQVRACACSLAVLVCVDGLSSYVRAIGQAFRVRILTGKVGRPRLERPPEVLLAQVIKNYAKRRVQSVTRRVVFGSTEAVKQVLTTTSGGTHQINTAYIERLNATFRACWAPLARRTRALAQQIPQLTAGMYLVGTVYNFCWEHESLRVRRVGPGRKWVQRTPAMAAGLTDHCWTLHEVLSYQVPPAPWVAPKRRGRPPKAQSAAASAPTRQRCPPTQPSREVAA
jgi:transposase-like protein